MIRFSRRGRLASMMVGALAATLMAPTAAPAGAATVSTADRAAAPTPQVVLKSDFGKAKSLVQGTFRNGTGKATGTFTPRRFFVNDRGMMMVAGGVDAKLVYASGRVERVSERVRTSVDRANGTAVAGDGAAAPPRPVRPPATCSTWSSGRWPRRAGSAGRPQQGRPEDRRRDRRRQPAGNLLCAVVGLLDGGLPGLLPQVANILNSILAILRL